MNEYSVRHDALHTLCTCTKNVTSEETNVKTITTTTNVNFPLHNFTSFFTVKECVRVF